MTWTKGLPAAEGRYWWRRKTKFDKDEYGLALIAWAHWMRDEQPPRLEARSIVIFGGPYSGECDDGMGWATSGGGSRIEDAEFWSEPERGPEGFLPKLPKKPDWTPPSPALLEEKQKKARAAAAKRQQKDQEEEDERAEKIAQAKAGGFSLYECEQCEDLWDEDEIIQVRECPHCDDERFNGTDEGQSCPSCNRRFTRNVTELGCPSCLEECEELSLESEPKPEPTSSSKSRKKKL